MKYLVTGGAGFIGSWLCERLLDKGEVVCLDNFDSYYSPQAKRKNIEPLTEHLNKEIMGIVLCFKVEIVDRFVNYFELLAFKPIIMWCAKFNLDKMYLQILLMCDCNE